MDVWIDLLTAIGLTPSGSSTVYIYTQTIHRTTQLIWEECGPCPVFGSYTLAFALQPRKKYGKPSVTQTSKEAIFKYINFKFLKIKYRNVLN